MPFEHSRKMALISEPGLQCYFGKGTVIYRKQLPTPQHPEFPDVFSKCAIEMLRKGTTQMHRMHTHFRCHVSERPLLLERVV